MCRACMHWLCVCAGLEADEASSSLCFPCMSELRTEARWYGRALFLSLNAAGKSLSEEGIPSNSQSWEGTFISQLKVHYIRLDIYRDGLILAYPMHDHHRKRGLYTCYEYQEHGRRIAAVNTAAPPTANVKSPEEQ